MATARKLPSGAWRVQITVNGERMSITKPTRKEAEYAALEYELEKKRKVSSVTVGEAIDGYIAMKDGVLSPSTIVGYKKIRRNNLPELMDLPIKKADAAAIQTAFNDEAKRGASPKTLANVRGLLSSALQMAGADMPKVTIPAKQKRFVDLLPLRTVINVVKGTEIEIPVLLASCLSLSMSEVRGLEFGDIKDGYITITRTVLDIDGEAVERNATKAYERRRKIKLPKHIEALIGTGTGKIVNLSCSAIEKRWERLLKKNGLPHMRFHDLRHLNASVMLKLGVPDKYAMERGGWATNSVMKNIYQHTFATEREKVDDDINAYLETLFAHENAHEVENA